MAEIMSTLKVTKAPNDLYDFTKLNNEQYMLFRNAFITNRMFTDFYKVEDNPKLMDQILNVLCMVICNRVPRNVVPFKCDSLVSKVRLVAPPRGMELKDRIVVEADGTETKIESNTSIRAVVRILVPKRKMTASEIEQEAEMEAQRAKSISPADTKSIKDGEESKNQSILSKRDEGEESRLGKSKLDTSGISAIEKSKDGAPVTERWIETDQ